MSSPIGVAELREYLRRDLPEALVDGPFPVIEPPATGHGMQFRANPYATEDVVIAAEHIVAAAVYLRDQLGYAYLSDIAVVDYLREDLFELVYRFYHPVGGPALVLKVRVARDEPEVPSLTPVWPGANFHEREAFDLFGVVFREHPYLRRIYMWDEFEGFPMRRDFSRQGDKYLGEDE